jgi:hypothetical protein
MDGTRTDDELVGSVLAAHPDEEPDAVRAAVDVFADSGHVEDVSIPDPPDLSDRDRERYDRAMRFCGGSTSPRGPAGGSRSGGWPSSAGSTRSRPPRSAAAAPEPGPIRPPQSRR